ncbi:amino acid/polyamine transporter I [Artemisia annua]|uniref:Amino acid/polyamine transporter I n=1 Tax=Artemisia annua TaxID=35608 RepID=A0A2U1PGG7_ARTAN|nr:amino acid/polyamine transporter I [Artemisia annua]
MSTNPPLSIEVDTLPVTNPVTTRIPKHRKKLTLIPLIFIIYFEVAGGPYGEEPVVKAAGPLFAILGFSIFPLIWLFWGSLMGSWKLLTSVINLSAFPILCVAYLEKLFPIFEDGLPRLLAIFILNLVLAFICFTGIDIVGYALIVLVVVSLAPFGIIFAMAIPHIKPHSTLAGEVEKPKKTFPRALLFAVLLTCLAYIVPLMAVTGAIELAQKQWDTGYMAVAAETIGGTWLKILINIGVALSAMGLYLALLGSCSFQILGQAALGNMSPETPANIKTTLRNTNTSPVYQNSPNTEGRYVELSQPQPDIELTQRALPSSPICSPLRQKLRRATESYEDLIGGQATFGIGQSSRQEMPWKNVEPNSPFPYTSDSSIPHLDQ